MKRCTDCDRPAKFAWRWQGQEAIQGYLCFICRSFTAGGRPGAEVHGVALPKHWHVMSHWQTA